MSRLRIGLRTFGLLTILVLLAACSQVGVPSQPEKAPIPVPAAKSTLTLATATTGGVFWPMGQEMATSWNKLPNVEVTAISTGGTTENIQKLGLKEVDLGFAVSGVVFYAVSGTGDYKVQGKQGALRGILALHPNVVHLVVRRESGIKSLKDTKGKAWGPGARGSATEVNTREILGIAGIDAGADLKGFYVGYDETVDNMKNRKIDGATLAAGIGGKAVKDALAIAGWELLSLSQADIDALIKQYPAYFPITIPAGTYQGQTTAVQTVAQASILITRDDISQDLIYKLIKSFYENLPALATKVSAAQEIKAENALKGITGVVPLHPGAEKYYREIGLIK